MSASPEPTQVKAELERSESESSEVELSEEESPEENPEKQEVSDDPEGLPSEASNLGSSPEEDQMECQPEEENVDLEGAESEGSSSDYSDAMDSPPIKQLVDPRVIPTNPLDKPKRLDHLFKGDYDYANRFESIAYEFFHLKPMDHVRGFEDSKNTTTTAYYQRKRRKLKADEDDWPEEEKEEYEETHEIFETLPGVLWTADEKEMFFRCLARYSIHRIDSFAEHLPTKSNVEILAYYELLKDALQQNMIPGKWTVRFNEAGSPIYDGVKHVYHYRYFRGARYSELPRAVELTEEEIEYEEEQAKHITSRELVIQKSREKASILRNYVGMEQLTNYESESEAESDKEDPAKSLLHYRNTMSLARVYRDNNINPEQRRMIPTRPMLGAVVFLEELAANITRNLIGTIVYLKGTDGMSLTSCDKGGKREERDVHDMDIWRACDDLKLFETQFGQYSRDRGGKTPLLSQYWNNTLDSLKLLGQLARMKDPKVQIFNSRGYQGISHDEVLAPLESVRDSYTDEAIEFSARGYYEELSETDYDLDEIYEEDMAGKNEEPQAKDGEIPSVLDLDVDSKSLKQKLIIDTLVEDMLIIKETEALEEMDGCEIEEVPMYEQMWGKTSQKQLAPAGLRVDWDRMFARY